MSTIKEAFQRFLSVALSVTTTLWLSGVALLLPVSPVLAVAPGDYGLTEGDLIRAPSLPAPEGFKVYIINQDGYKRHIFNPDVFNMYGHFTWGDVKDVSADVVNAFMTSDLYRIDGDPRVWSVDENGVRHHINMTAEQFVAEGYAWGQIFLINTTEGNYYTQGSDITSGTPSSSGNLTASLSPDTAAAAVLSSGTVFNSALTVRLSAGSNAATVNAITFKKTGLITNTLLDGFSLWQGSMRVSNVLTALTADSKVSLTLLTPVTIPANSSVDLELRVNISTTAVTGTYGFSVVSVSDINAGGTVVGTFPISGNGFSVIAGGNIAAYTIAAQAVGGGTSFPASGSGNLEIGVTQREVGKIKFDETSGNEDLLVEQLVLYIEGSVQAGDFTNWTLYDNNGVALGTGVVAMPYVTFILSSPYRVPEGTNRNLSVKADPVDGADRTLRVHVQNSYDAVVQGDETKAYVAPTSFSDTAASDGYWRLKQGALSVTKSSGSPGGNIAAGATDVVIAQFDLLATGEQLEIRRLDLEIVENATTTADLLTGNVKVQSGDGSVTYLSIAASTADLQIESDGENATRFNLNSYIVIPSGTTKTLRVVVTLKSGAGNAQTYKAQIKNYYVWRASTKDFADLLATSYAKGNTMTVQTAAATVARNSSIANKTVATGVTNEVLGSFVFQATAEALNISSVSIKYDSNNSGTNTAADDSSSDVSNVAFYINGVKYGTTVGNVSTGTTADTFFGTYKLEKDSTVIAEVKGDVKSGATGTFKAIITAVSATGVDTSNTVVPTNPNDDDADSTSNQAITTDFPRGQLITIGSGSVTISKDAGAPVAKIVTAGQTGIELSRIRFEALNDTLTLLKVRFEVHDAASSSRGKFIKSLYLYDTDGNDVGGGAKSVSADEALFAGLSVSLPAGGSKVLIVKADLSGHDAITSTSTDVTTLRVQIKEDSSTDNLHIIGTSGRIIHTGINNAAVDTNIAPSSDFLFHATYPVIVKSSVGSTTLGGSTAQEIYKFTVQSKTANIPIRLPQIKIKLTQSGMTAGDQIKTFSLWKGSTKVAEDTTTLLASSNGSPTLTFDSTNDTNDAFDPDSSVANTVDGIEVTGTPVTFTLKADTTSVTATKTSGTITVTSQIEGATGYDTSKDDEENDWEDGNVFYSYRQFNTTTYIGGKDTTDGFSASDSYTVDVQVLSVTL